MALEAACLHLKKQLTRLDALLEALRKRAADECPDAEHYLVERINDALPAAQGWLRKARKAVKQAGCGDPAPTARQSMTACDDALTKLRAVLRRDLVGANRLRDLADLSRRKGDVWGAWVNEVLPVLRDLRKTLATLPRAAADCWRELAAQAAGIVINNVAVGKQS